jgi:hypothetical protein
MLTTNLHQEPTLWIEELYLHFPNMSSRCGASLIKHRENFAPIGCTILLIYCTTKKVSWSGIFNIAFKNSPNFSNFYSFSEKGMTMDILRKNISREASIKYEWVRACAAIWFWHDTELTMFKIWNINVSYKIHWPILRYVKWNILKSSMTNFKKQNVISLKTHLRLYSFNYRSVYVCMPCK